MQLSPDIDPGILVKPRRSALIARAPIVVLLLLLIFQYLLFRQFVEREVAWAHPGAFDQTTYLLNSFKAFEDQLSHGLLRGAIDTLLTRSPNGVMLTAQASALYHFFGASRLTALTLSFIYLCVAEAVLFYTIWWMTSSSAYAFAALALYVLSCSRYYWIGGMFDFRIESIASSLLLVMLCLFVRSRLFASRPWSLAAGLSAALLIDFRFVSLSYVGIFFGITLVILFAMYFREKRDSLNVQRDRLVNFVLAVAMVVLLAGPLVVWNAAAISAYYGAHFGVEAVMRTVELGIKSKSDALIFYPRSIPLEHLGFAYAVGLVLFAVCAFSAGSTANTSATRASRRDLAWYAAIPATATIVLLVLVIVDPVKSSAISSIFVGPITLTVVLGAIAFFSNRAPHPTAFRVCAAVLLILAAAYCVSGSSRRWRLSGTRQSEANLANMYETVANYADQAGWNEPRIAADRVTDYLGPQMYSELLYERTGILRPAIVTFGPRNDRVDKNTALAELASANFAILTESFPSHASGTLFPFEQEAIELRDQIWAIARRDFTEIERTSYGDHQMVIFAKPAITVEGASGEWWTNTGAGLSAPCGILRSHQALIASGRDIFPDKIGNALKVDANMSVAGKTFPLQTTVSPITGNYTIAMEWPAGSLPGAGTCTISLAFDRYFVPKDAGINADARKLVILAPTHFTFR